MNSGVSVSYLTPLQKQSKKQISPSQSRALISRSPGFAQGMPPGLVGALACTPVPPGEFHFHRIDKHFRGHVSGRRTQPFVPPVSLIFASTEGDGRGRGRGGRGCRLQAGLPAGAPARGGNVFECTWLFPIQLESWSAVYRGEGRGSAAGRGRRVAGGPTDTLILPLHGCPCLALPRPPLRPSRPGSAPAAQCGCASQRRERRTLKKKFTEAGGRRGTRSGGHLSCNTACSKSGPPRRRTGQDSPRTARPWWVLGGLRMGFTSTILPTPRPHLWHSWAWGFVFCFSGHGVRPVISLQGGPT